MLIIEDDGPVLHLKLNRPEVRNAFNDDLIAQLSDTFRNLPSETRAVVMSGEGPTFCAGGDLQWMAKAATYSEEENIADALRLAELFDLMCKCPAVVITKVHGAAFGGGCGIVAASDISVATPGALFAFSEVRLGLVPATISRFVIAKIGVGNARALFTTGEGFSAEHALRIGLIHDLVDPALLDQAIESKLKSILAAGPEAVAQAKQLAQAPPMSLQAAASLLAKVRATEESREGIAAFLGKRKPSYRVER